MVHGYACTVIEHVIHSMVALLDCSSKFSQVRASFFCTAASFAQHQIILI